MQGDLEKKKKKKVLHGQKASSVKGQSKKVAEHISNRKWA